MSMSYIECRKRMITERTASQAYRVFPRADFGMPTVYVVLLSKGDRVVGGHSAMREFSHELDALRGAKELNKLNYMQV